MDIKVEECFEAGPALMAGMARLLPQLSGRLAVPDADALRRIVGAEQGRLLVARVGERVVGLLTIVWYDVPSGRKAWIEDVVTDAEFRGRGIGRRMVRKALEIARSVSADKVMLTSSAHRTAAHALYRSENFQTAETTVFAFKIPTEI